MYLRSTQWRNGDGSVVRYLQVARNRRAYGTERAEVLLNLGREELLDIDGLRSLVRSISRYLGEPAPGDDAGGAAEEFTVLSSRSIGVTWLLDGLWHQLGVDAALATVLDDRGFTPEVERALFAMVAHRAINPTSTVAEWITTDVAITNLAELDDELADRAIELLADVQVQEAVFRAAVEQLRLDGDLAAGSGAGPSRGDAAPDADCDDARHVTPTVPERIQRSADGDAGVQHDSSTTQDGTSARLAKPARSQRRHKEKKEKRKEKKERLTKADRKRQKKKKKKKQKKQKRRRTGSG